MIIKDISNIYTSILGLIDGIDSSSHNVEIIHKEVNNKLNLNNNLKYNIDNPSQNISCSPTKSPEIKKLTSSPFNLGAIGTPTSVIKRGSAKSNNFTVKVEKKDSTFDSPKKSILKNANPFQLHKSYNHTPNSSINKDKNFIFKSDNKSIISVKSPSTLNDKSILSTFQQKSDLKTKTIKADTHKILQGKINYIKYLEIKLSRGDRDKTNSNTLINKESETEECIFSDIRDDELDPECLTDRERRSCSLKRKSSEMMLMETLIQLKENRKSELPVTKANITNTPEYKIIKKKSRNVKNEELGGGFSGYTISVNNKSKTSTFKPAKYNKDNKDSKEINNFSSKLDQFDTFELK